MRGFAFFDCCRVSLSVLSLSLLALACEDTSATSQEQVPSGLSSGGASEAQEAGDPSVLLDAATPAEAAAEAGCAESGLVATPFNSGDAGVRFGQVAGDFRVTDWQGQVFQLAQQWGCDSYVFLVYFPDLRDSPRGAWLGDLLFGSSLDPLLRGGPENTRYVFLSFETEPAARRARMGALADRLEVALDEAGLSQSRRTWWRSRFVFATDRANEVQGSVGAFVSDYLTYLWSPDAIVDLGDRGRAQAPLPFVFGIDRAQRWDAGGSLSPAVGRPPEFGMAAFLGHYYQHSLELDRRLASETDAVVVPLLAERTHERVFVREAQLPNAAQMVDVDGMEIDVEVTCDERTPFACSEWDRIARVELCADGEQCEQPREIARWITPYWRRGRQHWTLDAAPLLGLLRDGGKQHFRIELGPPWERPTQWDVRIGLRLNARSGSPKARAAELAYRGGTFDQNYNDRPPFVFRPPRDAVRVELVTLLSGHGQESEHGCAEWCDHRHAFSVNDVALPALRHEGPPIGAPLGCAALARKGVLPGQWGNWSQSRAYWCPGYPVEALRTDITSYVRPGADNQLSYLGSLAGGPPEGGQIDLSTYVVWYTNDP